MRTDIIQISNELCVDCQVKSELSFRPLLAYLKNRLRTEKSLKSEFYRFLIEKIEKETLLRAASIHIDEIAKYKDTLELIYTILTPLLAKDEDVFWGLSTATPEYIFFSTDAFYQFFKDSEAQIQANHKLESAENKQLRFIYKLILERLYAFDAVIDEEVVYSHINEKTLLTQYFNIHINTQFVDIKHNGPLVELNFEELTIHHNEGEVLNYLLKVLPLSNFTFEGFTVINLTDITITHAVNQIRNLLVDHSYSTITYTQILQLLKTIGGSENIEFGLMPFVTVNQKLVLDHQEFSHCKLIQVAMESGLEEEVFLSLVDKYKDNPRSIFIHSLTEEGSKYDPILNTLKRSGISSYAVIPVFYNNKLSGIFEIYAYQQFTFDQSLLARLQTVMPLVGQLFQYSINEFNSQMDLVLKDKFTALQPSVQWKFNEAVYNFIKHKRISKSSKEIETVTFEDMYPLYGAIDIQNSTIERNLALQEDLLLQMQVLMDTLSLVKNYSKLNLIDKLIFNTENWLSKLKKNTSANEIVLINQFLEEEVLPFFKLEKINNPAAAKDIDSYLSSILPATGAAFTNRRLLESSMQMINTAVSRSLDLAQEDLQASFPCYFSRFRTDGVEYDIYIGQAIAPEKEFNALYLKNIRLWQLTSMVEISRLTRSLIKEMPRPLETTQLIFVHSNAIDISFRNDERRFDVEGAYNIRYEVIKKRIDKARIQGSSERLTQAHKIALVYSNTEEANEYIGYIKYLQVQGLLNDDLEYLEIESLQGVSGLKALRVGVTF